MWPWPNELSDYEKTHEANIAEKLNALRDLNDVLKEANISVQFENNDPWLPLFTKIFRVLTALVRKVYAK